LKLPGFKNTTDENACPCGSGKSYAKCCETYHHGTPPPTAEALMRARYSAYTMANDQYLRNTWHPGSRPEKISLKNNKNLQWTKLEILRKEKGKGKDKLGVIEFKAWYRSDDQNGYLHEVSNFVKEENTWLYFDGEVTIQSDDVVDDFKDFQPVRRRLSVEP